MGLPADEGKKIAHFQLDGSQLDHYQIKPNE